MNWDIAIWILLVIVYANVLKIKEEVEKWKKTN